MFLTEILNQIGNSIYFHVAIFQYKIAFKSYQMKSTSPNDNHTKLKYKSVKELPNFPFASIEEVHASVKRKQINFKIWTDVNLISEFGSNYSKNLKRSITVIQYCVIWTGILLPIIFSIASGNYWLLLTIPLSFLGTATTSPTSFRWIFILLAIGLVAFAPWIDNTTIQASFLFFGLSNLSINALRMVNEGTVLNIIYKNEEAFIWGYLNKAFTIVINKTGEALFPDLPSQFEKEQSQVQQTSVPKNNNVPINFPYRKGAKWGFANSNKEIAIECVFERACPFFEGIASVKMNGKWGCVNERGKLIIDCKYEDITHYYGVEGIRFFKEVAVVKLNDKYGFIDKRGNQIIPCSYDEVCSHYEKFSEGFAAVKVNNKWGFIDMAGKTVIPFAYDWADNFSEGLAAVKLKDKYGFIDKHGNVVIPFIYDETERFVEGLAVVKLIDRDTEFSDCRYGYVDRNGKQVISLIYDHAIEFTEGLACVSKQNKVGFIDPKGREVISCIYDDAWRFSEGMARVGKRGKGDFMDFTYGYIDKRGKQTIPYTYTFSDNFSDGLATIEVDSKYGFINSAGTVVIPCIYDDIGWKFVNGLARVAIKRNGIWEGGYIDTKGTEYWEK